MSRPKKKTLLELRQERKVKQRVLLDILQVDRKTLYNWEHCRTAPDHWQLQALCKFYAVKKESVLIAARYDPYAFLGDKTYEEWQEERKAFMMETQEWWHNNVTKRVEELQKYPANEFFR